MGFIFIRFLVKYRYLKYRKVLNYGYETDGRFFKTAKKRKKFNKICKKTLDFFHQLRYNNNRKKTTQISWDNTTTLKKL